MLYTAASKRNHKSMKDDWKVKSALADDSLIPVAFA